MVRSGHSQSKAPEQYFLALTLFVFIVMVAGIGRAQAPPPPPASPPPIPAELPPAQPPGSYSPDYPGPGGQSWIPDCSSELPVLPPQFQHLHKYTQDNNGTPLLLPEEVSFDAAPDGNGGSVIVYTGAKNTIAFDQNDDVSAIKNPQLGIGSRQIHTGYHVFIRKVDASGSIVAPDAQVGAADAIQFKPKIVQTSDGGFIVAYVQGNVSTLGNTQPFTIMMSKYTAAGAAVWAAPVSLSAGTNSFRVVYDFDLEPNTAGGAYVLTITNDYNNGAIDGFRRVLLQGVNNAGAILINAGNIYEGWLIVNDNANLKNTPILKYSSTSGNYDIAFRWVDPQNSTIAMLYMNSYRPGVGLLCATNGSPTYKYLTLSDEFFMMPFSWQGSPAAAVFAVDDQNVVRLWSFDMNISCSTNPIVIATQTPEPLSNAAFPAGLIRDNGNPNNHIIAVWYVNIVGSNPPRSKYMSMSYNTFPLMTNYWAAPVQIATGIIPTKKTTSVILHPTNGLFTVIPEIKREFITCQNIATGALVYSTDIPVRTSQTLNKVITQKPLRQIGTDHVYQVAVISGNSLLRCNLECGITDFQADYFQRFYYTVNKFHNSRDRDLFSWNSDLSVQSYSTTSTSLTPNFSNEIQLCATRMQRSLHSAAFRQYEASVWESFTADGIGNIFIAKRGFPPMQVTTGAGSTVNFINPKVAIGINYDNDPIACVTYVKEYTSGLQKQAAVMYRIVNLTSMVVGGETNLDVGVGELSSPNVDLLTDSVTGSFYAVYGKNFQPARISGSEGVQTDIFAARIAWSGMLVWTGVGVSSAALNEHKSEVAACFSGRNGDPGIYVVWRSRSPNSQSIDLQFVGAGGNTWLTGPQRHHVGEKERHHPCVDASDTWVMIAWDDTWPDDIRHIWATGHYNNGTAMQFWTVPQRIDSASIPLMVGEVDDFYEAHHPSIAASIPSNPDPNLEGCLVAFTETNDNDENIMDELTESYPGFDLRVGLRFIKVVRGIGPVSSLGPPQRHLTMYPAPIPDNDRTRSLFGFYGHSPKLIRRQPIISMPPPVDPAANNAILCIYETMPFIGTDFTYCEWGLGGYTPFMEAQLVGRLLTPMGDGTTAHYNIASGQGKQMLGNITHTAELGFIASYLDYGSSDNFSADVKNVRADNNIYFTMPTITVPPPPPLICGSANMTADFRSANVTLYNRSACQLTVGGLGLGIASPPQFSVSPFPFSSFTIQPYSPDNSTVSVYYTPQNYCDVLQAYLDPRMQMHSGTLGADLMAQEDYLNFSNPVIGNKIAFGGTIDQADLAFSATPVPARDRITLSMNNVQNRDLGIGIFNMLGQCVATDNFIGTNVVRRTLDVSSLPAGTYSIRLSIDGAWTAQQLTSIVK